MSDTIDEMKKDRTLLEERIFSLIQEFEKQWGVEVDLLEVNHTKMAGEREAKLFKVHVQVRVP